MTTEARSKVHVDNEWVGAHHAILVKSVVVIIASPGTLYLQVQKMLRFLAKPQTCSTHTLARGLAAKEFMGWDRSTDSSVIVRWQEHSVSKGLRYCSVIHMFDPKPSRNNYSLLVTFRVLKDGTL